MQSLHGVLDAWCLAQRPVKKRVFMELFARRAMRRAGAVLCTAKAELAQAERWLGASNGRVVPYIFDLSEFRDLPGAERAQKLIPAAVKSSRKLLYLSRLNYKKGPDVAIRALGLLRKRGVDAHLLMAGTGDAAYVAALEAEAKRSGVTDRVHFLGLVVGDDRLSLFQAADVFLLPTQQENFGFVTVEALACGTPIVTTDGVDIWPELEAGGGSRIVRRGNGRALDEGIADATAELLKEDTLEQRGSRGREGVFEWLDGTHVAEQYEDAYQRAARS